VVTPPLSLHDVTYAGGTVSLPARPAVGGEDLLATHLRDAERILAAAPAPDLTSHPGNVSADFEHLRWFDLPEGTLGQGVQGDQGLPGD
jgi:hypothetical protein